MKQKTVFKKIFAGVVMLLSMTICSCNKEKDSNSENKENVFTDAKSVAIKGDEQSAYEVQLTLESGSIPKSFQLNMPGGETYNVTITAQSKGFEGADIYTGNINDKATEGFPSGPSNFVLVDDRAKQSVHAEFSIDHVNYTLSKNKSNSSRLAAVKSTQGVDDAVLNESVQLASVAGGEQCNGVYIIDLFVGYSTAAATSIGSANINSHANSLVATVNTALTNSLVTNVKLRLVGTGTTPNNPGIVTSVLTNGPTWFSSQLTSTGADLLCVVQNSTGASGEAAGWASVPGWVSVVSSTSANAFRHEVGHNLGSSHCTPGTTPYASGYDNGNWKTIMCGNSTSYYSNPYINDNLGNPLGNISSADNARMWRERASAMSGRVARTIAFPNCTQTNVNLYKDCAYGGGFVTLGVGSYPTSYLIARGMTDNAISSVKVAPGRTLILYENNNYTGASKTITANDDCLQTEGWSDRASSIKIQ